MRAYAHATVKFVTNLKIIDYTVYFFKISGIICAVASTLNNDLLKYKTGHVKKSRS